MHVILFLFNCCLRALSAWGDGENPRAPAPDERVAVLICGAKTTAVRFD
jgi:hypothetical protein